MIDLFELLKKRIEEKPYVLTNEKIFFSEMREVFQELLLHAFSELKFFDNNAFHGGTALRLKYGSKRYSEDLDFNMKYYDPNFSLISYFDKLNDYTKKLGFELILIEKESTEKKMVKKLMLNGKNMLDVIHNKGIVPKNFTKLPRQNIKVKIESGYYRSNFKSEKKTLSFPTKFNIEIFDIHCLFAGKLHAALNRTIKIKDKNEKGEVIGEHREDEDKGRDWYDLIWYIKQGVEPNWGYSKEKFNEVGKWKGQEINTDEKWLKDQLILRMNGLNYDKINEDLSAYLDKDNNFILNKAVIDQHIDLMGKNGYK